MISDRIAKKQRLCVADFNDHWHVIRFSSDPSQDSGNHDINRALPELQEYALTVAPHTQIEVAWQIARIVANGPNFKLKDPRKARAKGRPVGAMNRKTGSTRRDPSGFEYVEGSAQLKRQCSVYKRFGHNKRTCDASQLSADWKDI